MTDSGTRPPPHGLYDKPITRELDAALATVAQELVHTTELDEHMGAIALGRLLHRHIVSALKSLPGENKTAEQVALANRLLDVLRAEAPRSKLSANDAVAPPPRRLLAVLPPVEAPARPIAPPRPAISLASSDLLVNGPHDLSLGPEVQKEIASADRVDLLCSFLKWSGVRLVEEPLRMLCRRPRDAQGRAPLRVLTTAYMMATERRALDALVDMGADVRVSYDTTQTRLHAKAWLFHRATEFSTAYVGSSNLSAAAMLDGLEWNVRLSATDNEAILEKFASAFEQYWRDSTNFRPYVPAEFDAAVQRAQRSALAPYLFLELEPRQHQKEILEDLAAERARGHTRNLVVAATGTGKTIVAALDYKRLRSELPRDRLLFVAHRREILEQSKKTFEVVLREGGFGETLMAGRQPDRWEHVFASIQSLDEKRLDAIPPDHFDVVIVDEFHHAAADTYEALLARVCERTLVDRPAPRRRLRGRRPRARRRPARARAVAHAPSRRPPSSRRHPRPRDEAVAATSGRR